jgi:hypothetical protein
MKRNLNLDLIFPIRDTSSAELMAVKARCLHKAGVIGRVQKDMILCKSAKALLGQKALVGQKCEDVSVYGLKAYSHRPSKYGLAA